MLVLSRRLKEKIVLPTIGTTVQVLEIKGSVVRLGIEAPPEVTVHRAEVQDRISWVPKRRLVAESKCKETAPRLQASLACTGMGLGLARLQLDAELTEDARGTLEAVHADFQLLLYGMAEERPERENYVARQRAVFEQFHDQHVGRANFMVSESWLRRRPTVARARAR